MIALAIILVALILATLLYVGTKLYLYYIVEAFGRIVAAIEEPLDREEL